MYKRSSVDSAEKKNQEKYFPCSRKRVLNRVRNNETPIPGIDSEHLVKSIIHHGHKDARTLDSLDNLADAIRDLAEPGAMVVCLGAGDITGYANALAEKLAG